MAEKDIILESLYKSLKFLSDKKEDNKKLYEITMKNPSYKGPREPFEQNFTRHVNGLKDLIASVESGKEIDTKEKKKYVCDAITTYLIDKLHAEKIMRRILVDESHQLLDESLKEVYAIQQRYCDGAPIGVADSVIKELTKSV